MPDEKRATIPLGLRLTREDVQLMEEISQAMKLPHQVKVVRWALRRAHDTLVAQGVLPSRSPQAPAQDPERAVPEESQTNLTQSLHSELARLQDSARKIEDLLALHKIPA